MNKTHFFCCPRQGIVALRCKEELEMAGRNPRREGMKVALSLIEKPVNKEKREHGYFQPPCRQSRKLHVGFVQMIPGTRLYPALLPTCLAQHVPIKIFTYPFHQWYIDITWN